GYDDGTRGLPSNFPGKSAFSQLSQAEKTAYAKEFKNIWSTTKKSGASFNQNLAFNGGFNANLGSKNKFAAIFALNYNRSNKSVVYENQVNTVQNNIASTSFDYDNTKYSQD